MTRPLYTIARDIRADIKAGNWKAPGRAYAEPYIAALGELDGIGDRYGCDSAKSIVAYFLANASTWRGDMARAIKVELNGMIA